MNWIYQRLLFNKSNKTFEKKLLLLASKLIEKKTDPANAKEYYNSYLKGKNAKLVKRS